MIDLFLACGVITIIALALSQAIVYIYKKLDKDE